MELEKMTQGICGLKPCNALALYDPNTHFWKTSQGFFPSIISAELLEIWPRQGIMQNGLLWERTMWERTTDENDCGYWLTPSTITIDGGKDRREKRKAYRESTGRQDNCGSLAEQVKYPQMWPTPSATEGQRGVNSDVELLKQGKTHREKGNKSQIQVTLDKAVRFWNTPKHGDLRSGLQKRQFNQMLNVQVCREEKITGSGGTLNPTWVEWLMGWPSEWTDLKPLETGKFRSAWLTPFQSYLKELLNEPEIKNSEVTSRES